MASSVILRGPIPTGLKDLRRGAPRCSLSVKRTTAFACLAKSSASAVSDATRRLPARGAAASVPARPTPCPIAAAAAAAAATRSRSNVVTAAAASAAAAGDASPGAGGNVVAEVQRLVGALSKQASRFWQLSGKFMPMVGLFFMLAFVNTILDSLKDTLVITAVGGGAQVIPYLTVYAVLPSSLVFLLLYSYASQRFRRQALFNGIVGVFMAFFVAFAYALYPNHHLLHPSGWADGLAASLPLGLDGAVGMVRNWTFTLFFCMSELWGDVCLGLLFWGLANDTTSLADAPTLYPLFGLGANVAQALAGFVLKFFSGSASHGSASFTSEVQSLMGVVLFFSALALALHHGISVRDNQQRAARTANRRAEKAAERAAVAAAAAERAAAVDAVAAAADSSMRTAENQMNPGSAASTSRDNGAAGAAAAASNESGSGGGAAGAEGSSRRRKGKQNLSEIYRTLASSVPIRCLVVMSMAQGLCTNLMEFAWKSHIRLLYPTPAEFTSFLGDVSTWQGIVTGLLMVLSPTMFERMGWAGVAAATPRILLYGGGLFFATAMAYQFMLAPTAAAAASSAGLGVLQLLVYGGALLYVFSKSAKFSLFKPAEEMVYISLDEEGRTKGKAAIDVVGSQAGKSGGSVLQQVLLLLCGGAIAGQLPAMVAVYLAMSQSWLRAVATLSTVNNYGHASSVHESMQESSLDEKEEQAHHDDHHHHHHHHHHDQDGGDHHNHHHGHGHGHSHHQGQDRQLQLQQAREEERHEGRAVADFERSRAATWAAASSGDGGDSSVYGNGNGNGAAHVSYQALDRDGGEGVRVGANGHHGNGNGNGHANGHANGNGYGNGYVGLNGNGSNGHHNGNGNGNGNGKYGERAVEAVVLDSLSAAA